MFELLLTADPTTVIYAAPSGDSFATTIRDFVAPIFLLIIGIVALTFLWKRQVTEFFQFFAIAVGVAVFFYFPETIKGVAEVLRDALT